MAKSLVIVESPAKAKTINKYLGGDYVVVSSVGHIRDLPVKSSGAGGSAKKMPKDLSAAEKEEFKKNRQYENLIRTMAVDPENGWKARYEIIPGKGRILKQLKILASETRDIYLATDLDREGEAIAWHLRESIGGDLDRYKRVTFSEITKSAIQQAFASPGELNMDHVNAQQARRFLDRVVGFMLSPLLWNKVARGLSAGRVQSVAVRLVVEREREIRAFVPEEYWEIFADLKGKSPFRAKVIKYGDKKFLPVSKQQADKALAELEKQHYRVTDRTLKPVKQNPYPPFITTTMQAAASVRLGYSVKKTMMMAQRLYEAGFITYMRTDSTNMSFDSVNACRSFIGHNFGEKYVPEKPRFYASKKGAQEAHEAIRPTDVNKVPDRMAALLDRDQARLYELIWRQFVACQMPAAEFDSTTIDIRAGEYRLRATGRIMRFDGWMKVLPPQKSEDSELPEVTAGEELKLLKLDPGQHFTKPPARYTEATLVKELEKRGIGRPSTYASIISTIQDRGYVKLEKRRFYAQKIGDIVTDRLTENFDDLMDYGFTANMELDLDKISEGHLEWRKVLDEFYKQFKQELENAKSAMRRNQPVVVGDIECNLCGKPMMIRNARTGVFLSCTGYDLPPKERCKGTINLVPAEESVSVGDKDDEEAEARELLSKKRCPVCKTAMDSYLVDEKRRLHICGNNPDCPGHEIEEGSFRLKGYDGPVLECDKCGADMALKTGRFGKFFACSRYPECSNTRKLLRNGEPAPPRAEPVHMPELKCEKSDAYFLLRDGAAGLFLAASTFPKSRETKSPLVEYLARHRSELDPKFHYLADAPAADPDGNASVIRFKKKEKIQYLMSEIDGKKTGWEAFYQNGVWEWKQTKSKKKKAEKK